MEQTEFGDFGGDDERDAEAEAAAVAGNGSGDAAEVVDVEAYQYPEADDEVTLSVMQVDYKIHGRGSDEFPVIHVFGRTPESRRLVHVEVYEFRPYFYAPTASIDEGDLARDRITGTEETDADGTHYESIRGERLTKIFGQTPRDVGQIRDEFDHYEADILFPNRFLIDKGINSGITVPERYVEDTGESLIRVPHDEVEPTDTSVSPRVNVFDIEVDDRSGFPEDGEEPIICLTSHDSYDDEYIAWLYDADMGIEAPDELDGYDPIEGDFEADVRIYGTEEAMLDAYLEYLTDQTDPDVITGWNCLPGDSTVLMADGRDRAISDVQVGDEVVGSDDQETTVAKVTNKWQSEREIYEFELADGTSLRTSGDHRVMVGDDEQVDWKEGRDISAGDYVLKPKKLRVETEVVPELSDLVPVENQRFEERDTISEFKSGLPYGAVTDLADRFDLASGTLHHPKTDVWTPDRCRIAADEYDVSIPDGGREYRRTRVDLDRDITKQEIYLAGLVLTDGSMSTEDGIRFYNTREELHEQFPGETRLEPDGKGCYKQNVLDFAMAHTFNGLGIPFGDKNEGTVDLSTVYEMPEVYIERFLAGVIDGDGNVSSSVTVAAENRSIGEWYTKLFRRLGIYAQQREHIVRVPSAERELSRLKQSVLPHMSHSEKVTAIENLEGGKSGQSENIPYALFEAETGSDEKRIGRDKHRRGIHLKRHETTVDDWEEYVFVAVENVEQTKTETTYDIETTTHNFIAENCLVHNCDDFDAPYLLDRLEELQGPHHDYDLDLDRLSRIDEVWRSDWQGPDIKGRVVFDLLRAYKRTQFTELESYRLDAVGETELDAGKERYAGDIGDLWENDPERLLEYNLRDVELCVELDRKQDIIAFFEEVASFVGCKLEDAPTPGDAVDMYVLHKAHGEFALPSKGTVESGEEFEGGAVFEPITGVKEMVSVLDLKSLYPMAMVTINASPETKVEPEEYNGETYVAPNGQHFRKEPDGMMREMVDELLTEREEKKGLRNEHEPGTESYERFDRQQAAVKVIMNCFTPDTDVLTPDGVRNIRDLDVGDEVYSLDPDTLEMEVKPVTETHAYPDYEGELVDIETDRIDFRVTPNHRMLVGKDETNGISWDEDDYRFVEAGDLDDATNYQLPHDWSMSHGDPLETVDLTELVDGEYEVWVRPDVHGHTFASEIGYYPDKVLKNDVGEEGYVFGPAEFETHREYLEDVSRRSYVHGESGRKWIPRTYDGDDFLELLAWYVTEGSVHTSEEKQFGDKLRGSATTIQLAQDAPVAADGGESDHAAIGDLLDRMGFDYYVDGKGYQFASRLLGDLLETLCGGNSFEKRIPEFVFETSRKQKRRFLETLIAGDGDWRENSWRYSTTSEELRDDVLRLCTHLGLTANYRDDDGTWRISVSEDSKNTLRMHRSSSRSEASDGVYCVTVDDNNTLLAGRNGKFQFVGQSLYGVSGWDRFRLYDKDNAAAVTATGREVIEFTEETANDLDKEVIYGDSVTGDRPVVVRDPDGMVRIVPIEDLFERAAHDHRPSVMISTDGGGVHSIDTGKDRRSLDGWDALSLSRTGEAEWQPVQQVIRHEADEEVLTLQHKLGESTTTRDHSYVVEDGDEFVEAPPSEVEEPIRIPDVPDTDTRTEIDIYEVLDGYTCEYEDGRSVGSENAVTETKRVHADDEWVWFGHEHQRDQDKTVRVKRRIDLTGEDGHALIRLLAAYVTEGSASTIETTDTRFGASIAESRSEWLAGLQEDYYRLFDGTTASVIASDSGGSRTIEYETTDDIRQLTYEDETLKLQLMNELAAVFFREFAGQTSRGKRVPSFVFHLPEPEQDLFLQFLIEGDGSRSFPRYSDEYAERNFDFETTSRELAAGLSMLLTQRGRKHSLKYREQKGSYTIRTCDYYRRGRDPVLTESEHDGYVYDLSVAQNDTFVDAVGGIVLHNTDSVMLELDDFDNAETSDIEVPSERREAHPEMDERDLRALQFAVETSFELEDFINDSYDEFAREELNAHEHRFQIEFEKLYRRFFQAGKKKRYAGHIIWKEGKDVDDIDITGFEYKRSDIAPITKEVQKRVIEMIVKGEDLDEVKDYLHDIIQNFQAGNVDLDEIGIPGGIGKRLDNYDTDTAHVRGAKYANMMLGTNFQRGSKPKRLYLDRVHDDFFQRVEREEGLDPSEDVLYGEFRREQDVICFEYADQVPEEFEIDYEKMLDKTLKGPIARILEALDVSWEEVKSGQEQTGLGKFM
jgi:DNA polymerase I